VIGDRRKLLSALVMIDEDNVSNTPRTRSSSPPTALTQDPEIKKLIQREMEAVNESLSRVEQVKKFTILPKKLYVEDGEVTPTMKVKRKFVNEAFKDLIEAMY
jgi:long-chain acyl-CoA synthetase